MAENAVNSLGSQDSLASDLQEKLSHLLPADAKEKLFGIFERYKELNDEEKEEVLDSFFGKLKQTLHDKVNNDSNLFTQFFYIHTYTIFFFAVLLIFLVFVFFVYKLFKCLTEREAKREEKKKNKQLKKKK